MKFSQNLISIRVRVRHTWIVRFCGIFVFPHCMTTYSFASTLHTKYMKCMLTNFTKLLNYLDIVAIEFWTNSAVTMLWFYQPIWNSKFDKKCIANISRSTWIQLPKKMSWKLQQDQLLELLSQFVIWCADRRVSIHPIMMVQQSLQAKHKLYNILQSIGILRSSQNSFIDIAPW